MLLLHTMLIVSLWNESMLQPVVFCINWRYEATWAKSRRACPLPAEPILIEHPCPAWAHANKSSYSISLLSLHTFGNSASVLMKGGCRGGTNSCWLGHDPLVICGTLLDQHRIRSRVSPYIWGRGEEGEERKKRKRFRIKDSLCQAFLKLPLDWLLPLKSQLSIPLL